jgi:radical SAM protein (TIGR01212 family)
VHVILGIPAETWDDMMRAALEVSSLPVSGVKVHHLHVIKGTRLEELYDEGKVSLMGFKEYISTLCDFLERLRPDILIHRLLGDRPVDTLVAPRWATHKGTVLRAVEEEFASRCTHQGFLT